MPDSLRRPIALSRAPTYPTTEQVEDAKRVLADVSKALEPAQRGSILARCSALLAHYWTPEMEERVQEAVARDWGIVLANEPIRALDAACHRYLAEEPRKRPTPGAIKAICDDILSEERRAYAVCRQIVRGAPEKPEKRGERATPQQVSEILAKRGWRKTPDGRLINPHERASEESA